jgi:hypothetical protein
MLYKLKESTDEEGLKQRTIEMVARNEESAKTSFTSSF